MTPRSSSTPQGQDGTPATARPGDRPGLPMDVEPFVVFHALLAGEARPGTRAPTSGLPPFEEEPAVFLDPS